MRAATCLSCCRGQVEQRLPIRKPRQLLRPLLHIHPHPTGEVSITLISETDPYLFLLDESGEITAENDDIDSSGGNHDSEISGTLNPGAYTIEATTYNQPATGDFTLTVIGIGQLDDRAALTALYNATDGDNWTDNTNWAHSRTSIRVVRRNHR